MIKVKLRNCKREQISVSSCQLTLSSSVSARDQFYFVPVICERV